MWHVFPRCRDEHCDGVEQFAPGKFQQLQDVVEAQRIAPRRFDHREQVANPLAPEVGAKFRLAGTHPVPVALQRVDLAIVCQPAKRLGQVPGWEGVGAVALVEECKCTLELRILEIQVEASQVASDKQPLVDECPAGQ